MRGLQVKNGVVDNVAEFDSLNDLFNGWIEAPDGVGIGWTDAGDGTFSEPVVIVPNPTPEEAAAVAKMAGVDFEGVMCSATAEDMWGLSSIKDWIKSGQSVGFQFQNGNTLQITPLNIDAFESVWIPFRASFF